MTDPRRTRVRGTVFLGMVRSFARLVGIHANLSVARRVRTPGLCSRGGTDRMARLPHKGLWVVHACHHVWIGQYAQDWTRRRS